jgi:biotin carboxyl carrier protein
MAYEISNEHKTVKIELQKREGTRAVVKVDDHKYEIDILQVEKGIYSILYKGLSYNVELFRTDSSKKYIVNTLMKSFHVEVIDEESRYIQSRKKGLDMEGENNVASPMPGKVIKIPVNNGDQVSAGQTLIVVEAMKMQSEFKATSDKTVREILVKEGDTVNAHQVMMRLE